MNDDQFEQRLRRALHQHAERQVDAHAPLPPMRRPEGRWATRPPFLLPLLAAAVVVLATGGTVLAARSAGHTQHAAQTPHPSSTVAPESQSLGGTGTGTLPAPSSAPRKPTTTAPSSKPVPTSATPPPPTRSDTPSSGIPPSRPVSSSHHTSHAPPPPASSSALPSGPNVPCRGDQLALAVGGDRQVSGSASYNDYDFVYITNTAGTCKLAGYPSVLAADGTGSLVGSPATHLASPAPTTLVLQHGDRAEIDVYDRYGSSASCQGDVQGQLILTPPGGGTATLSGWQYSACNLAVTAFQPARPPEQHT